MTDRNHAGSTLYIWDSSDPPPTVPGMRVLWQSFGGKKDDRTVSVPRLVEEHAQSLRRQYLAWIHAFGQCRVHGMRVIDHLEIRPGFSMWWMTLLAQKCTYARSPAIYDAIRLLALDAYCKQREVSHVEVVTANTSLAKALEQWAAECGASFARLPSPRGVQTQHKASQSGGAFRRMPALIRATLMALRFAWNRRAIASHAPPKSVKDGIAFVDILTHFDAPAAEAGEFRSSYWTALAAAAQRERWTCTWLHYWHRYRATPTVAGARRLVDALNGPEAMAKHGSSSVHVLIDGNFGVAQLARVMRDLLRLRGVARALRAVDCWRPEGTRVNLQPLLGDDWKDSLLGAPAATNLCYVEATDRALARLPRQRVGAYIQENQPWEFALLHAWRKHGHGTIVGTPHTTVRFWDLRYFYDPRSFDGSQSSVPAPDLIAITGDAAAAALAGGWAPPERLTRVEALRYLHLGSQFSNAPPASAPRTPVLLVATDLLDRNTRKQMQCVDAALRQCPHPFSVVVKPHPASDFSATDYPHWQDRVDRSELSELIARADVVLSSNASSAAIDAHLAGKTVLTMLDGDRFNFSPLRGLSGTAYIADEGDLLHHLSALASAPAAADLVHRAVPQEYFHLDPALPRWRALLRQGVA